MKRLAPRILLVDDHPLMRAGLRSEIHVTLPAALVSEAEDASTALASISACRPELILLDVNLPGENGIDLARKIRAMDKRAKILMVAGEADAWTVNEALEAGASGFMSKTRSAEFLAQAISAVLKGEIFLCPDAQAALQSVETCGGTTNEPPGPAILSAREREVLKYLAHGENTKTIASLLKVSPKTIETHRQHIMKKLALPSVAGLTRYAIRHGLISA